MVVAARREQQLFKVTSASPNTRPEEALKIDLAKVHKAIVCTQSKYFEVACQDTRTKGAANELTLASDQDDPASDDPEADLPPGLRGFDKTGLTPTELLPRTFDRNPLAHAKVFAAEMEFSDLVVKRGPHELKVHKAIACAQSKHLEIPYQDDMKSS
ncbi:unnamed protein product [Zymoseptoria tritici ST99CH_3D7]|uniref:BTB domain-containing protein n=1 Tax=Zymoseptoria tritici (strain ST99CH_3D7) TaxID=1276538 RepID=A0A1X7S5Y6_ZYMT9|nr:unnamed protein product [Zymoseptoria tritici ST99CH_3D7]